MRDLARNILAKGLSALALRHDVSRAIRLRKKSARRILIVDSRVPEPTFGAGHPRARMLYDSLCEEAYEVDVYTTEADALEVARFGRTVGRSGLFCGSLNGLPSFLQQKYLNYETVFVSRPTNMSVVARALGSNLKTRMGSCLWVYDAEAVWSLRSHAKNSKAVADELGLSAFVDVTVAVSEAEAALFNDKHPGAAEVLSQFSFARYQEASFEARKGLLFVGRLTGSSEDSPNVQSVVWFIDHVMPLLGVSIPKVVLSLAGRVASFEIQARLSDHVRLVGSPDDLSTLYAQAKVFIVPTQAAAGVPTKLIDACMAGLPCVATPLIVSQIGLSNGFNVMTAESPEDFAVACARLYNEKALWLAVRDRAYEAISLQFSRDVFRRRLREILARSRYAQCRAMLPLATEGKLSFARQRDGLRK